MAQNTQTKQTMLMKTASIIQLENTRRHYKFKTSKKKKKKKSVFYFCAQKAQL